MQTDQTKLTTKAPAEGKPRYKKGTFPAYDREYDRLSKRSLILNRSNDRQDIRNAFSGSGIGECKGDLLELVGNDNGMYTRDGTLYTALIPAAKSNLKSVHEDFRRWQKAQVREGKALEAPKEWPEEMLAERLKAEARLDVRRAEKHFLEDRIKLLKRQQGKSSPKEPVLPDGPVGNFSVEYYGKNKRKTRLASVDGQKIDFAENGIPFIDEPESPYHLMPVATYRAMSKQWMKENRIRKMDIVERCNEFKEQAKQKEIKLPAMFTSKKYESLIKGMVFKGQENFPDFDPWPDNPEWPDGAKPITELTTVDPVDA